MPGKKIEHFHDEIDNIQLSADETSHVIIHTGTNNVPTDSADLCVSKMQKLALRAQNKFPNSKIAISSVTHRDDINMSAKIVGINGMFKEMAKNKGFAFIDNSNIDSTCINGSKLHLNAKGSAYLATNFIKFIRPKHKQVARYSKDFQNPIYQLGQLLTQFATKPQK